MLRDDSIPRLVRRVRLRWDEVRASHVVLFPEGVLVLNAAAAQVLTRVDGARSVGAIIEDIAATHRDADRDQVAEDVRALLTRVRNRGFLTWSDEAP